MSSLRAQLIQSNNVNSNGAFGERKTVGFKLAGTLNGEDSSLFGLTMSLNPETFSKTLGTDISKFSQEQLAAVISKLLTSGRLEINSVEAFSEAKTVTVTTFEDLMSSL